MLFALLNGIVMAAYLATLWPSIVGVTHASADRLATVAGVVGVHVVLLLSTIPTRGR